jgi:phage gpG-like protein
MYDISSDIRDAGINLKKIAGSLESIQLLRRAGFEVAQQARRNAFARPGRSFWRKVGLSVSQQSQGGTVVVGATHEAAAQKQFGGVISAPGKGPGATGAKHLTIPLGVARERRWDVDKAESKFNIFSVKSKKGALLLFGSLKAQKKRRKEAARPLFLLKKSVSQYPEPWFPEGAELKNAIARGIEDYIRRANA